MMSNTMQISNGLYQILTLGAQTIEKNIRLSQFPKSRKEYNVSNAALFPTIPLTNVVIGNLHLFLRVSDVLIDLIIELRFHDCIDEVKKFSNFDCGKYKHIYGYQHFVTGLGIPGFQFYVGQSSKAFKCCSLTGPEKLKVFESINIQMLLPLVNSEHCSRIQHLCSRYFLNQQKNCRKWLSMSMTTGQDSGAIPERPGYPIHTCHGESCA